MPVLESVYTPTIAQQNLNIIIYGVQGVGKTTLAGTAQDHPAMRDVLFLNIEGGTLSIMERELDVIDVYSINRIEELFWEIRKSLQEGKCKYRTVIIDSGTEMQTLATEASAEAGRVRAENRGKERDRDEIFLEDYGKSTAQISRLMRWFRDLPVNVIITALPGHVFPPGNVQNAAPIECRPEFTKKLASRIVGYMDMCWYMYERDGKRYLLTQNQGIYRAKTRGLRFSQALGPVVENPNLAELYQKLLDTERNENDSRAAGS